MFWPNTAEGLVTVLSNKFISSEETVIEKEYRKTSFQKHMSAVEL